jgi:hypothetical protein
MVVVASVAVVLAVMVKVVTSTVAVACDTVGCTDGEICSVGSKTELRSSI